MTQASSLSRRQVIIFALITASLVAGDSMLYVVLPVHWKNAGLSSLWEVGLLLSLNRLARLPLNPFAGWAYSKISTKTGAVLAGLIAVGTTLGYGLVEGLAAWAVLRVLWGLSWSFLKLGGLLTVMDGAGENERGYLVGLYSGVYRLGSLAGMLGGGLIADLFGLKATKVYQVLFIAMVVVGATVSLDVVWDIADTFNGLMAIPNFIALFALSGVVTKLTREYFSDQRLKPHK